MSPDEIAALRARVNGPGAGFPCTRAELHALLNAAEEALRLQRTATNEAQVYLDRLAEIDDLTTERDRLAAALGRMLDSVGRESQAAAIMAAHAALKGTP